MGGMTKIPSPQVWPTLRANDVQALLTFLTAAFGFVETAAHRSGDQIVHAEVAWPAGGGVMIGAVQDRGADDPWPQPPAGSGVYVVTDDPEGAFTRAVGAGAEVVQPLQQTSYGTQEFAVRDPEGNLWAFGSYRGAPR
jgi:uncharacterized glyoxalase superfamily protein PhnB